MVSTRSRRKDTTVTTISDTAIKLDNPKLNMKPTMKNKGKVIVDLTNDTELDPVPAIDVQDSNISCSVTLDEIDHSSVSSVKKSTRKRKAKKYFSSSDEDEYALQSEEEKPAAKKKKNSKLPLPKIEDDSHAIDDIYPQNKEAEGYQDLFGLFMKASNDVPELWWRYFPNTLDVNCNEETENIVPTDSTDLFLFKTLATSQQVVPDCTDVNSPQEIIREFTYCWTIRRPKLTDHGALEMPINYEYKKFYMDEKSNYQDDEVTKRSKLLRLVKDDPYYQIPLKSSMDAGRFVTLDAKKCIVPTSVDSSYECVRWKTVKGQETVLDLRIINQSVWMESNHGDKEKLFNRFFRFSITETANLPAYRMNVPGEKGYSISVYLKTKEFVEYFEENGYFPFTEVFELLSTSVEVSTSKKKFILSDTLASSQKQPAGEFKLSLYDYQQRTLDWMCNLESDFNARQLLTHPMIKSGGNSRMLKLSPNGPYYYGGTKSLYRYNYFAAEANETAKVECRCGLDISRVGSGKTVTMLALIHTLPFKSALDVKFERPEHRETFLLSTASLIICPANLAAQWKSEALKCLPKSAKVIVLTTIVDHRKYSWNDILLADLVIITVAFLQNKSYLSMVGNIVGERYHYEEVSKKQRERIKNSSLHALEEQNASFQRHMDIFINKLIAQGRKGFGTVKGQAIIERIYWHRIVVDEFHELSESERKSNVVLFFNQFRARFYWGLTGTPKCESVNEIREMAEYLRFKQLPSVDEDCQDFLNRFVRRNNPDLQIPPVSYETIRINLTAEEMGLYNTLGGTQMNRLMMCNHHQVTDEMHGITNGKLMTVGQVSQILQKKREKEIKSLTTEVSRNIAELKEYEKKHKDKMSEDKKTVVKNKQQHIGYMQGLLKRKTAEYEFYNGVLDGVKKAEDHQCPICLDTITVGQMLDVTSCGHIFCVACMLSLMRERQRCPMCRQVIDSTSRMILQPANTAVDEEEIQDTSGEFLKYGSKINHLVKYIRKVTGEDGTARIILFCQFARLSKLVADALREAGIELVSVGNSNVHVRQAAIRTFKSSTNCKVIMLNSEDSVSGLHLTEANHVIIMHPFLVGNREATAIAYEKQGIARAVRAGQTRPVHVVRFMTAGTIEEEILERRKAIS